MTPVCLALSTLLCIPPEYASVTKVTGFVVQVDDRGKPVQIAASDIQRLGVEVDLLVYDQIIAVSDATLSKVCIGVHCMSYIKHCDSKALHCDYAMGQFEFGLHPQLEEFRIRYLTVGALKRAENGISVRIRSGATNSSLVPLVSFSHESYSMAVVECRRRNVVFQGCPSSLTR